MLRFHYPKDSYEEKLYRYHESNLYNGSSRRYGNLNYVDHRERRVSYEEKHRQREIQELRRALNQMEKNLDEWFENFNLEEAVKKLERSKVKVVNTDDAKVDDDNREMVEESEINVELEEEEEEKSGVNDEKEKENIVVVDEVKAEDDHGEQAEDTGDVDAGNVVVDELFELIKEEVVEEIIDKEGQLQIKESMLEVSDINEFMEPKQVKEADEWFELSGGYAIDGVDCRVDAKKLWELLFQRGFVELEAIPKPSIAGYFYLIFFEFCRLLFDPGGHSFKIRGRIFAKKGRVIRARPPPGHPPSDERLTRDQVFKFKAKVRIHEYTTI